MLFLPVNHQNNTDNAIVFNLVSAVSALEVNIIGTFANNSSTNLVL